MKNWPVWRRGCLAPWCIGPPSTTRQPACHAGRVTDLMEAVGLAADARAYVCGPPAMVEAVRQSVVKAGAAGCDVLCERFS
ncbi:hypothetical protein HRF68_22030 [Pseudomonas stutzeri]|nr:hypothetical protein [Stutzerimonas stutzeri]